MFVFCSCSSKSTNALSIPELSNAHKVKTTKGSLYISSQPSQKSLQALKNKGFKTIINVRMPSEMQFDEAKAAKDLKMNYHNIPVSPKTLTWKQVNEVAQILNNGNNYPILFHCASGNRAAMIYALKQIENKKEDVKTAIKNAKSYGLTKKFLEEKIKELAQESK